VRWQARGRPESLLLRGEELDAANAWQAKRKDGAPEITETQRTFLQASNEAETARLGKERTHLEDMRRAREATARSLQRTRQMSALVVALLLGIGAGLAWSNRSYLKALAVLLAEKVWPKVLTNAKERALNPKDTFKECADCPEMVVVPAGKFMMGSSEKEFGHLENEGPQHWVTIPRPFAVARFELTFDEWDACVTLGGCSYLPSDQGWGRGTRPVINVSSEDAEQYVAWLSRRTGKSYRLLSEAEWEYAARAGSDRAFSWGDEIGKGNANCKICGSQWDLKQTATVGSFAPNAFGLYDMHGNVFEWTQDCLHNSYNGAPEDGSTWKIGGDCESRLVRGGGWDVPPEFIRSASRWRLKTHYRSSDVSFRVGRTLSTDN
jgi:formylglycine-generating enzyme required for sulfatase activity